MDLYPHLAPFSSAFQTPENTSRHQASAAWIWFPIQNHTGADCSLHHTLDHKPVLLSQLPSVVSTTLGRDSP